MSRGLHIFVFRARERGIGCARCVDGKLFDEELSGLAYLGSAEARTRICTFTIILGLLRLITPTFLASHLCSAVEDIFTSLVRP